jgi:hypothetical protein
MKLVLTFLALAVLGADTVMTSAQNPSSSAAPDAPLKVGHHLPPLEGEFLTGREARLPDVAVGQVAFVALGFTYASRHPVEAWVEWFEQRYHSRSGVTFFEVPVIGGVARMGRWFINSGMRRGTPKELHEHVITVYGNSGEWKRRFAVKNDEAACLVVLDQAGTIRWLHEGAFDEAKAAELARVIELWLAAPPRP